MKKSKSELYEMMVILKPLFPDDVRKAVHKSLVDLCKDLGGEVTDADVWGKRYLAYKIRSHDEGYYIVYTLELPADQLKEFRRLVDLKQEILRYLLVKVEENDLERNKIKKKDMKVNI